MKNEYAIALGNFDGIHLGHQYVIETTLQRAREYNYKSAIVTFFPHPKQVLCNTLNYNILSLNDKISLIKQMGIDEVIVIDFTKEFAMQSAECFIQYLCSKINIRFITTGSNFKFGYKRAGNICTINCLQSIYNFEFNAISELSYNHIKISSSILRKSLKLGCMKIFKYLTSRYYIIKCILKSIVVDKVIFEIINIDIMIPPSGLYIANILHKYYCVYLHDYYIEVFNYHNNTTVLNISLVQILTLLDSQMFIKLKIDHYIKLVNNLNLQTCIK